MLIGNRTFTRKKALLIVGCFALAFVVLIAIKGLSLAKASRSPDTLDGRISYLRSFGWEISVESENVKTVKFPEQFGKVMEDYAALQQSQGFDIEKYKGKECTQYTYLLTNYPQTGAEVYITVYVFKGNIIAGDIHTASSDGFMHGFIRSSEI